MAKTETLPTGVRKLGEGRYQARISVGGVQQNVGVYPSKTDARDARSLALAQLRRGDYVQASGPRMRFDAWAQEWLELTRGGNSKTLSFLRSRILPWWGEKRLGDITSADVQRWINALVDEGLSPATIHALHNTFKRMLDSAAHHDKILINKACRNNVLPKQRRHKPTRLTLADLRRLEGLVPAQHSAMIHLGWAAGLRWQEVAALRWENVDLETGLLRICEAIKVSGEVGTTKNERTRTVPIGQMTVDILRAHRRDHGQHDLLFVGARGRRLLSYANFNRYVFIPAAKQLGLEERPSFHDLRHWYGAHMRLHLDPQTLTDNMGHGKISTNTDLYGYSRQDAHAATIAALDALLNKGEMA